jgi:hypothetical protein
MSSSESAELTSLSTTRIPTRSESALVTIQLLRRMLYILIWKATTYVEPAEWLYDVVVADGSVIRLGGRD